MLELKSLLLRRVFRSQKILKAETIVAYSILWTSKSQFIYSVLIHEKLKGFESNIQIAHIIKRELFPLK